MWYALGLVSTGVYLAMLGVVLVSRYLRHADRLNRIVEVIADTDTDDPRPAHTDVGRSARSLA